MVPPGIPFPSGAPQLCWPAAPLEQQVVQAAAVPEVVTAAPEEALLSELAAQIHGLPRSSGAGLAATSRAAAAAVHRAVGWQQGGREAAAGLAAHRQLPAAHVERRQVGSQPVSSHWPPIAAVAAAANSHQDAQRVVFFHGK